MAEKNLKITLVKSPIGAVPKHRATVTAMGLTKMHKTVIMPDNASTRGMIQQVSGNGIIQFTPGGWLQAQR